MTTSPVQSLALLPGGRVDLSSHADGIVIESLALHRSDEGGYWAAASRNLNLIELLATVLEEHSAAGQPAFLDRYERLIGDFFQQRYGAELTGETWAAERAEFSAPIRGVTDAGSVLQAAWFRTDILDLNEDIKFHRLAPLIAARIRGSVSVMNRRQAFGSGMRMNDRQITDMVETRYGRSGISDGCAVAIARTLASHGSYPGLRALGAAGYTDFDTVSNDLKSAFGQAGRDPVLRRRTEMLAGWTMEARAAA